MISNFLTIQSLANFPAITGAIAVAWKALQALDESTFGSRLTPLLLAAAWLLVSLVLSAREADRATVRSAWYWSGTIFVGMLNMAVLFAASLGIS
ncbi:hypothetical protein K1W54_12375 [Micromonospora sp. CPCC 205371]|nr:hypothetical protein [Micromonospora sp. CPCC 205371]